jgi:hypothetical protein
LDIIDLANPEISSFRYSVCLSSVDNVFPPALVTFQEDCDKGENNVAE